MFDELKEFYLTWLKMANIVPSNKEQIAIGEELAQKLLDLSDRINKLLDRLEE